MIYNCYEFPLVKAGARVCHFRGCNAGWVLQGAVVGPFFGVLLGLAALKQTSASPGQWPLVLSGVKGLSGLRPIIKWKFQDAGKVKGKCDHGSMLRSAPVLSAGAGEFCGVLSWDCSVSWAFPERKLPSCVKAQKAAPPNRGGRGGGGGVALVAMCNLSPVQASGL